MNLFECITQRRSVRRFTNEAVPEEVMQKALDASLLAPNSSNMQTWRFYWLRSIDLKSKAVDLCLRQSAARQAQELLVVTAEPKLWKIAREDMLRYCQEIEAPTPVVKYYQSIIPITYRWGLFNFYALLKWILCTFYGLFKPMVRGPFTKRDIQEIAIKSAALACENFVLAIQAQGFNTCMMEGFDEKRMKSLLSLSSSARVVMVIAVGKASETGTWGERRRLNRSTIIFEK